MKTALIILSITVVLLGWTIWSVNNYYTNEIKMNYVLKTDNKSFNNERDAKNEKLESLNKQAEKNITDSKKMLDEIKLTKIETDKNYRESRVILEETRGNKTNTQFFIDLINHNTVLCKSEQGTEHEYDDDSFIIRQCKKCKGLIKYYVISVEDLLNK